MIKKTGLFLLGIFSMLAFSCQKQPEASFTTDKTEYIAGETIQLQNTSADAQSYQWTMPDGQMTTSTNANYSINRTWGFGTLNFELKAESKNGKKTSTAYHSVNFIPASTFSIDSTAFVYYPINVTTGINTGNWQINAWYAPYQPQGISYNDANAYMNILFPSSTLPVPAGIYNLQLGTTLLPGQAMIRMSRWWWEDNWERFESLSGTLNVSYINGKMHVVFSSVDAQKTDSWGNTYPVAKISGDITCH